jgi:isoamylase
MVRFVAGLIALRKRHRSLRRRHFLRDGDIRWFGRSTAATALGRPGRRELAFTLCAVATPTKPPLHLMINLGPKARTCLLPKPPAGLVWAIAVDSGAPAPGT